MNSDLIAFRWNWEFDSWSLCGNKLIVNMLKLTGKVGPPVPPRPIAKLKQRNSTSVYKRSKTDIPH